MAKNDRIGLDEEDADEVFGDLLKEAKKSSPPAKSEPLPKYEPTAKPKPE